MSKKKTDKFDCASNMPPLSHSIPGTDFSILDSEVVNWLISQPSIAQFVFNRAKSLLKYDKEAGTWQGIDYDA